MNSDLKCIHRLAQVRTARCRCNGGADVAVYGCAVHGECRLHDVTLLREGSSLEERPQPQACSFCPQRQEVEGEPIQLPAQRIIKVNSDFSGFGDAAFMAWASEGSKNAPVKLIHYATGAKAEFLRMLGQEVTDDPVGSITTVDAYHIETQIEKGTVPRHISRARAVGITATPRRPENIQIEQGAISAARKHRAHFDDLGQPFVVLFPQTEYRCREWPASYWVDLAWRLHSKGVGVKIKITRDCPLGCDGPGDASCPNAGSQPGYWHRFINTPGYLWDSSWHFNAALMQQADLCIGVSSGPASLAACLGTPFLVLEGPTAFSPLWDHAPNVVPLSATKLEMACVGCYFQQPWRAACDQGCMALGRLFPERVLDKALELISDRRSKLRAI